MTEQQATKRRSNLRSLVIVFVTMFLLTAVNILYTNQEARKFCSLMVTLDEAYNQSGSRPTTTVGKRVATNVHDLRKSLGCEEK